MQVKKYVGNNMQDTIFKIKADLGSDAIILNTRKFKKGGFLGFFGQEQVEILAAIEEKKESAEINQALVEIKGLKNVVQNLGKNWQNDKLFNNLSPEINKIYHHLRNHNINEKFLEELLIQLREIEINQKGNPLDLAREILVKTIGKAEAIKVNNSRKVVAFVGPTGVGKTTTIAKIAASFALDQGKKVGLITADTYRIAAVAQLQTYSDIINIPLHVAYNQQELKKIITQEFANYDLVLIDTAGSSWKDKMQMCRLKSFVRHELLDELHLILSLNMKSTNLQEIMVFFSILKPTKLILTKLDETVTYGDLINLKQEHNLPYSYITDGQDVPDDIKEAKAEFLVDYLLGDLHE